MPSMDSTYKIRLTTELRDALQRQADAEGRPLANLMRHAWVRYLDQADQPNGVNGSGE